MWVVDILAYAKGCLKDYKEMSGVDLSVCVSPEDLYTDSTADTKWHLCFGDEKVTSDMSTTEFLDFLKFLAPNKSSFFKEKLRLKHTISSKGTLIVPYKKMNMDFLSNFCVPFTVAKGHIFISGITNKERIPEILDDLRIYGKVEQ